jgi:hypothetical protein
MIFLFHAFIVIVILIYLFFLVVSDITYHILHKTYCFTTFGYWVINLKFQVYAAAPVAVVVTYIFSADLYSLLSLSIWSVVYSCLWLAETIQAAVTIFCM